MIFLFQCSTAARTRNRTALTAAAARCKPVHHVKQVHVTTYVHRYGLLSDLKVARAELLREFWEFSRCCGGYTLLILLVVVSVNLQKILVICTNANVALSRRITLRFARHGPRSGDTCHHKACVILTLLHMTDVMPGRRTVQRCCSCNSARFRWISSARESSSCSALIEY